MDRTGRAIAALALTVGAVVLAGCSNGPAPSPGPSIPPGITAPPPTPVGEATPEPTQAEPADSSLPAVIAGVDTAGWQQLPPVVGDLATFRLPPDWTYEAIDGGVAVLRADGERQLALTIGAAGDSAPTTDRCLDEAGTAVAWRTSPLDRQPVQVAGASDLAFGASALQLGDRWIVSMGLLPTAAAQSPRCPVINGFQAESGYVSFASETVVQGAGAASVWVVGSLADAQAYTGTEEFATIRAILMSLELLPQG